MGYFSGKRCFVTGAASGIGKATALALAKEGAVLAITDINTDQLQQTATEIQQLGAELILVQAADIADFAAIAQMADVLHSQYGDRKSTRLNSSHVRISYAVFCLKKKK